jgi:ferric-dicitrate binding protein FerR (iron transport regulator)
MAKFTHDDVLDAALAKVATATRMVVTSAQPANFAGIAAVALADVTLTAGAGNGDYTIANGDTSGRKLTVAAQSSIPVDSSGTATHVCLDDGSTLLQVTTCTSQALTSGNTVDVPAYDIEFADVTP